MFHLFTQLSPLTAQILLSKGVLDNGSDANMKEILTTIFENTYIYLDELVLFRFEARRLFNSLVTFSFLYVLCISIFFILASI